MSGRSARDPGYDSRLSMARGLAAAGLWDHLPPYFQRSAFRAVVDGGYPFDPDALGGFVMFEMDGEELAEGGVEDFLMTLRPGLERHGIVLSIDSRPNAETPDEEDSYMIGINGQKCIVLTAAEFDSDNPWYLASVRPLATLNDILISSRSAPRMFVLHAGDNGGYALLINPAIPAIMQDYGIFEDDDIPIYPARL